MEALEQQSESLADWLRRHPRIAVITGAGVSVESGIPAWRDGEGRWVRSDPIRHQEFLREPAARRRYWGRSMLGWPQVRAARPNRAHLALAELERRGLVELLVTQNVDRLHQRAGSRAVIDLHGRLDRVRCLGCGSLTDRESLQARLEGLNPGLGGADPTMLPDGDAALEDRALNRFRVPECPRCAGVLMPDVVFFGGSIPPSRLERCQQAVDRADALLAVGSSLQVFSGFRFCRHARRSGKPLAVLNPGSSRADDIATARFSAACGPLLAMTLARL